MRGEVLRREVADHLWGTAAWAVGAVVLASVYIFLYPSVHRSGAGIQKLLNSMPKAFRDAFLGAGVSYLSPAGYLGSEMFAFLAPALILALGILAGSRALAAEERDGTIDLLLATPVTRRELVIEKALGALAPVVVVGAILWIAVAGIGPSQGLHLSLVRLAVAIAAVALMGAGFGMVALLVGAATGSVGTGGQVAAALAVGAYILNLIGSLVPALQGFAHAVSPFHWIGGPGVLVHGVSGLDLALLILLPVALLGASIAVYERRDLAA